MSDSQSRAAYDSGGMDGLNPTNGMPGMNDLFAQFFAGNGASFGFDFGPGNGGRRRGKGDDVLNYDVTLEDLYNGKSVKMNMEKEVVCALCKG